MSQIKAIYTALNFIEDHLKAEIRLEDIATAAGYSLYHFIRTFNQTVRHTPYDYLMRRRLSESAKDLVGSQRRIVDIAAEYCFNNHETFSRAFKRMFAMQPNQCRANGKIPYRTLLPPLSLPYLKHINQPGIIKPQFIVRSQTTLFGLMNQDDEIKSDLWQTLSFTLSANSYARISEGYYGIRMVPENQVSFCFVGLESVPGESPLPPLCSLQLPAGLYVELFHLGGWKTLPLSLDYLYHTWLAKTKYKHQRPMEVLFFPHNMPLDDRESTRWQIQLPIKASNSATARSTKTAQGSFP